MADLNRNKDAAKTTKIVGSDQNGTETNFLGINDEGEIKVSSFPNISYVSIVKPVSTTEVLASVGASNLTGRKTLTIYNKGSQDIYYGPSGVTDLTGIPIFKDEILNIDVGDNVEIFLITKTGTSDVVIQEFS